MTKLLSRSRAPFLLIGGLFWVAACGSSDNSGSGGFPDGGCFTPGCPGVGGNGAGGLAGTGSTVSTGGSGSALCGNGVVDTGEDCDGSLNGQTCQSWTLGALPNGTLSCTNACQFDTSGCSSSGVGGTGSGGTGSGGTRGSGGAGGGP